MHANRAIVLELHTVPILALLGENGAGKSTLVSILAGNLNEALSLSDRIGLSMAGVTS